MAKEFFEQRRPHQGLTYEQYLEQLKRTAEAEEQAGNGNGKPGYLQLNLQRSQRIEKTYEVSERLRTLLQAIEEPQLWMVLTEPWCGDSAQNLPYIARLAACNPNLDLRILLRDENLDIMEHYLTDGKRGIPKLVAFDREGHELFQWGPRPKPAMDLFLRNRKAGLSKPAIMEKLHLWYARDRGQTLEEEFVELLQKHVVRSKTAA